MPLLVKKLSEDATIPVRATIGSAGYDLSSSVDILVPALGRIPVPTGLAIVVPENTYGMIASRSGNAKKYGIGVLTGTIDSDYRGEVFVLLFNTSERDFIINKGDRVAQLILSKIETPDVAEIIDIGETDRGEGGFGSTGK
ncbi:dUTP pyrophosphatase [Paramecium bursaria Chlorella virus NE-JV-1]|nr:dUTP pyrophosphatase [Paramecium bursaria Chlorella virus NE-JV-1]